VMAESTSTRGKDCTRNTARFHQQAKVLTERNAIRNLRDTAVLWNAVESINDGVCHNALLEVGSSLAARPQGCCDSGHPYK